MKRDRAGIGTWLVASVAMGALFFSAAFPGSAPVAGEPPTSVREDVYYVVREGDSLWRITGRFYEDPFLWPFVWRNNAYIANPHWIYPGDRIFLTEVAAGVSRVAPQDAAALKRPGSLPAAPKTVALPRNVADTALITETGHVARGWVLESLDGRTMLTQGDDLLLEMSGDERVEPGERFQVIRSVRPIRHPDSRKTLGNLVRLVGYVETLEPGGSGVVPARVLLSNAGLQAGDTVARDVVFASGGVSPKPALRSVEGCIVASLNDTEAISQYDVCFIDRGLADGVEVGDSFRVMRPGKEVRGHGERRSVTTPDMRIGGLVVLFAEKHVSTALVTESLLPFQVGSPVISSTE